LDDGGGYFSRRRKKGVGHQKGGRRGGGKKKLENQSKKSRIKRAGDEHMNHCREQNEGKRKEKGSETENLTKKGVLHSDRKELTSSLESL